jgi:hypothetical protein
VVEHLLSKCETLSSNPRTTTTKKEYYSASKRKGIVKHLTARMKVKDIMLSVTSQ